MGQKVRETELSISFTDGNRGDVFSHYHKNPVAVQFPVCSSPYKASSRA